MDDRGNRPAPAHRPHHRDYATPSAMERHRDDDKRRGNRPRNGSQQRREGLDPVHDAIYRTYK